MKTKKRLLSILLSLVMVLGMLAGLSQTAFADVVASGTTEDELSWKVEKKDEKYTLTIFAQNGIEGMQDYPDERPWNAYISSIDMVVIESGVTKIGAYAFYNCANLKTVVIDKSVRAIARDAFKDCTSLTDVRFVPASNGDTLKIGAEAFPAGAKLSSYGEEANAATTISLSPGGSDSDVIHTGTELKQFNGRTLTWRKAISLTVDIQNLTIGPAYREKLTADVPGGGNVIWSVDNNHVKLYTKEEEGVEVGAGATDKMEVYAEGISVGETNITVKRAGHPDEAASVSMKVKNANPITYGSYKNQSFTLTYDTSARQQTIQTATGAVGNVSYAIAGDAEKEIGDNLWGAADVTFTISTDGTRLNIPAGLGAGTYRILVSANAAIEETDVNYANYWDGSAGSTIKLTVNKADNSLSYTATQTKTATFSTASQTVTLDSASGGEGDVSYAIQSQTSGGSSVNHFTLNGTTLTLAANTPAGTYTVAVRATAAGDDNHNSGTRDSNVTVTVSKAQVTAPSLSHAYDGSSHKASDEVSSEALYRVKTDASGTEIGNYSAVLTLKDANNYKWPNSDSADLTVTFSITKGTATVTEPTPGAVTYDPNNTLANVSLTGGWQWVNQNTVPEGNNSGYSAELSVDDTHYNYDDIDGYSSSTHKVTRTISLTVNKADNPLTYGANVTQTKEATFSTSSQTVTLAAASDGEGNVTYAVNSQKNASDANVNYFSVSGTTLTLAASTPVGTYTVVVRASAAGNNNYNSIDKDSTVTVTVNRATASDVTLPAPDAVRYDPEQTLADVSLDGGWEWVTPSTVPTIGNSGYSAALSVDDANYNYDAIEDYDAQTHKVTRTVSLTVNKGTNPLTYDEKQTKKASFRTVSQTVTLAAASKGQGDVTYAIQSQKNSSDEDVNSFTLNDDGTTLTLAASTPAGTYTVVVRASAAGNDNYESGTKDSTVTVTVEKADANVTAPTAKKLTYNRSAQELVKAGSTADGTLYYAMTREDTNPDASDYGTSIPRGTESGTYYVWYKVTGDKNHNDAAPDKISVTINPKSDVTAAQKKGETLYYDGTPQTPTLEVKDGTVTLTCYTVKYVGVKPTNYAESENAPTGAGSYKAVITLSGNYTGTKEAAFTIEKKKAPTKRPMARTGLSYTGKPQELVTPPNRLIEGYTEIKYSINDGKKWSKEVPTATDAGNYTVKVKYIGDSNHSTFEGDEIAVSIKKADPTAKAPTGLTATVGQTLADVKLTNPDGNTEGEWKWADSSTKLEKAGEQSFKASFTPKDTDNYKSKEKVAVKVTVEEPEKESEKEEKITATSDFRTLRLRVDKRDKSSIKLKWEKKDKADGYKIYGGVCNGKEDEMELLKTITNKKTTSWTHKKLKKGTSYKYKVVAYKKVKGEKKSLYKSVAIHAYTKGGKYTVAKGVKVNKSEVKLKKGNTFQIEASEVKDEKKKDISQHRAICYESSNEKVATVNEKGKVKAKKKGSATVYVYSETGAFKKVKINVK